MAVRARTIFRRLSTVKLSCTGEGQVKGTSVGAGVNKGDPAADVGTVVLITGVGELLTELVTTVGMRADGCSGTGCMVDGSSSDSNEAVESCIVASELVTGLDVGNIGVPLGWADSSNSVEGCNTNSLLDNAMSPVGELTGSSTIVLGSGNSKVVEVSS